LCAELDALYELGWRGTLFIVDDNFIGNKRNVKKLVPELANWQDRHGRPFNFLTEASLNLADDDALLADMQRAGFHRVFLGIETPVEESLLEAHKTQNTRGDMLESVKKIQSYGMEVMAGFIVGFDNDPEDIFERQIKFIKDSAIPLAMVGLLTALPDTQLWRRLKKEGRLVAESRGNNTSDSLNFVPKMDPHRLIEGYRSIMRTIYNPREYYDRAAECLSRVSTAAPESNHYGLLYGITALTRIVIRLGVLDKERREFWRFFARAVSEFRNLLPHSLRLAAMGYHFRILADEYCEGEVADLKLTP
jgi:radical SAM superfamily enzyme YgiQ (UPF0313 family)